MVLTEDRGTNIQDIAFTIRIVPELWSLPGITSGRNGQER
jgi:hypothetical protein